VGSVSTYREPSSHSGCTFGRLDLTARALKFFKEALEKIQDEAVKNAFMRLAKLSEVRSWMAHIIGEIVSLELDVMIEPILEKLAEERKFLDNMK